MAREAIGYEDSATDVDVESNADSDGEFTPSEQSPLLPNDLPPEILPPKSFQHKVLFMCILCLFIVEVSQFIMDPPLQKIMEDIICRNYYPDHALRMPEIKDHRCKNTEVQKTLAMVKGWALAADMAAPIVAQFPFGIIADKYGRRPVLFLALLGCLLQTGWVMMILLFPNVFSIWAMLPGSVFFLIGGGAPMAGAMAWTIIADVTPAAERANVFFLMNAIVGSLNVVINPIAAFLLKFDPWLPMWLGLGFLVAGTFSTLLIPETLKLRQKADDKRRHEQHPSEPARDEQNETERDESFPKHNILKQAWFTVKNDMGHVWQFIFASKSIMVLIISFAAFTPIRFTYTSILLQYMTKRFNWDWSKATYISTAGTLATIVCLLVILPMSSKLISKFSKLGPMQRDLQLTRVSMIFTTVGCLFMALAGTSWLFITSIIIYSLGNGFIPLCRALLNSVVEPHTVATLNTTIALIELLMGLVSGPAMGWLLSRGLDLGGAWLGLPFLVSTGLAVCITVAVSAFRIPTGVAQAHEE
ncbi:Fc.00g057620.m01.CDS01 [Cosmosporella sp. VM-42]